MLVELFGPPGAGKTTFTRAIGARLEAIGMPTAFLLSYRPAERMGGPGDIQVRRSATQLATLRRLCRPAVELLGGACRQIVHRSAAGTTGQLLALMPPQDAFWAIRLRQYLQRLERAWQQALGADAVVLCDQGYLQAVASLLVLAGSDRSNSVSPALALLPVADLRVRLDVPIEILTERLERRYREQGRFERLLELDLARNLAFVPALMCLDAALEERGLPVVRVGCSDQTEMEEEAIRVVSMIDDAWPIARVRST